MMALRSAEISSSVKGGSNSSCEVLVPLASSLKLPESFVDSLTDFFSTGNEKLSCRKDAGSLVDGPALGNTLVDGESEYSDFFNSSARISSWKISNRPIFSNK